MTPDAKIFTGDLDDPIRESYTGLFMLCEDGKPAVVGRILPVVKDVIFGRNMIKFCMELARIPIGNGKWADCPLQDLWKATWIEYCSVWRRDDPEKSPKAKEL